MDSMEICDMCGSKIESGKCECGIWKSAEECKDDPIKLSLEKFHELKEFTLTAYMPHLGCAVIFFRGDYVDCKNIEAFIHKMKGRPYYG